MPEIYSLMEEEHHSENEEMYLKSMWLLEEEGKKPVKVTDIARILKVSLPSAVQMLKKMHKKDLVKYSGKKGIYFKPKGKRTASKLVRNLRLVELLVRDILKIKRETPFACKIEHHVSDEIAKSLRKVLNNPNVCPHSKPIPKI